MMRDDPAARRFGRILAGFAAITVALAGCASPVDAPTEPDFLDTDPEIAISALVDAAGDPITAGTAAGTLVHQRSLDGPLAVLTPTGEPVTWGAFRSVRGQLGLTCAPGGTVVELDAMNLLPDATYTATLRGADTPRAIGPTGRLDVTATTDAYGRLSIESWVEAGAGEPECLVDADGARVTLTYRQATDVDVEHASFHTTDPQR